MRLPQRRFWPKTVRVALTCMGCLCPLAARAQPTAPITVTPPTLAPKQEEGGFQVTIPESGGLQPPSGAENLSVLVQDVTVTGIFPRVAQQAEPLLARLKGQRVSLKDIYAVASAIEALHARAGYVLARVSVPPQELRDGGTLTLIVTDGFIEGVDASALPRRIRSAISARTAPIEDASQLTLSRIEEPLMIASDIPGLRLSSTLMRGTRPGGTRLILTGDHRLLSGTVSTNNNLAHTLGTYSLSAQLSLNSALRMGEQIYAFGLGGYNPRRWFRSTAPVRVVGGGLILPSGNGRWSLNPEATFSRTAPAAAAGSPRLVGTLTRLSLRANYVLARSRAKSSGLSLTLEHMNEKNAAPDFNTLISHDRYAAARIGANIVKRNSNGQIVGLSVQLSQGLGGIGAAKAAASIIPVSRQFASPHFSKLMIEGQTSQPLGKHLAATFQVKGQISFSKPLLRSEQFSLEGSDADSASVGGATAVDEGFTARMEFSPQAPLGGASGKASLTPYLFAASSLGRINAPTALEPSHIWAGAFGAGARTDFGKSGLSLTVEYAHGIASYTPISKADRLNASAIYRF